MILDKKGLLGGVSPEANTYLELGCGDRKRHANAIGIDALDFPDVDVVGDVFEVLGLLPDGSVAGVYSYHFFEHIEDIERLFSEVTRVLKSGGELKVVVPHFSNAFFYSDLTHRHPFGLYSFSYFCNDSLFKRTVPKYLREMKCELRDVRLVFKSYPPRYIRHAFRKSVELLVNSSRYVQELYEENWTGFVSCYEIDYRMRRL